MKRATIAVLALTAAACTSSPPVAEQPSPQPCITGLCLRTVGADPAIVTHGWGSSELMPLRRARLQWIADESCLVAVVGPEQRAAGIVSDKVIPVCPRA